MNSIEVTDDKKSETPSAVKEEKRNTKTGKNAGESFLLFKREEASRWLPFVLFLFALVIVYITIQQFSERTVRQTEKINHDIKELRSEYLSTKAELMQSSLQTDIAKKLESSGLKELREPAVKYNLQTVPANPERKK